VDRIGEHTAVSVATEKFFGGIKDAGGASLSVVLVGEMLRFLHFYVIANSTESSNSTCSAIQSAVAETSGAQSGAA